MFGLMVEQGDGELGSGAGINGESRDFFSMVPELGRREFGEAGVAL